MKGRGSSLPLRQTGMVESRTVSCPTMSMPRERIGGLEGGALLGLEVGADHRAVLHQAGDGALERPGPARNPRCPRARSRAPPAGRTTRWRRSAAAAPRPAPARRSSAGSSSSPAASTRPEPSALTTATPPARTACTSPGTPSREREFSSSGSAKSASRRRTSTSARLRPGDRAHIDRIVAHREVFALHQHEAEIAGEIGVLEIGLVQRTGGEQARPGLRRNGRAWSGSPARTGRSRRAGPRSANGRGPAWRGRARCGSPAHSRRPDGDCVRSDSTHQRPSGPRPRSAA